MMSPASSRLVTGPRMSIEDQSWRRRILNERPSQNVRICRPEGPHLPSTEDGLFRIVPPRGFSAWTAVTQEEARGASVSDPRQILMKLRIIWDVNLPADGSVCWWAPRVVTLT